MGRFYHPVETHIGAGKLLELPTLIQQNARIASRIQDRKILLVTRGGTFTTSELCERLLKQLAVEHYDVQMYEVEVANPDIADLFAAIQATERYAYELVVAVGGGSVLDVAKSMAAFRQMPLADAADLRQHLQQQSYRSNPAICPWVGVPTTSGTGSEVTPWATIWDREYNVKYSVDGPECFAAMAIIDPVLTLTLPERLTMVTGLDAICHATEAYWSKSTNVISRVYALEAVQRLIHTLPKLASEPTNLDLRTDAAIGSLLAGMAFSNTRTTACHSVSYPLTLLFGIEHGVAASLTLSAIMAHNEAAIVEKERLFAAFAAEDVAGVQKTLDKLYQKAGLSTRLADYNVPRDGLQDVVDKAYTKGRMDNNPLPIEPEQLLQILTSIY